MHTDRDELNRQKLTQTTWVNAQEQKASDRIHEQINTLLINTGVVAMNTIDVEEEEKEDDADEDEEEEVADE